MRRALADVEDSGSLAAALQEDARDARRFRAMLAVARIKLWGFGGVDADGNLEARGYVHFGAEFWSQGGDGDSARGRQVLAAFADACALQVGHRDTNGASPAPAVLLDRPELELVRAALAFYANPASWETGVRFEHDHPSPAVRECGQRARDALNALDGTAL